MSKRDFDLCHLYEVSLISAVKRMSGLELLRWYRLPRPLIDGYDDIWTTLQGLGTDIYDGEAVVTSDTVCNFPICEKN